MKVIRQLLITWMIVAFLMLQGFGQDAKPPPPPRPLPLPTKIIPKSVSDENSSGNNDKLKLTTIKQRRTIKIPPRKQGPDLDWSDFIYNSPEEKAFWDKLPDWSDKVLVGSPYIRSGKQIIKKRNAQGETIESNSSEGYDGYVKDKSDSLRTIYQLVDGYAVRRKSYRKDGQKAFEGKYKRGIPYGPRTFWHESGQSSERNFKDGARNWLETWWYANGQKQFEINYKDGKKDGLSITWDRKGYKYIEGNYKDGKQDGLETRWYENGQKKLKTNYKDGKEDGLRTMWYENGQKKSESNYKDGKLDGFWTIWYENGQKKEERNYKEKIFITAKVWLPDGKECPESKVIDGNGTLVTYSLDGKEISRLNFKDGIGRPKVPTLPRLIPKRPLVLSEANSTTRPRFRPPRSQPPLKLPDRLRKLPASSEANSSKPTPPSLPPWLVPAAPK